MFQHITVLCCRLASAWLFRVQLTTALDSFDISDHINLGNNVLEIDVTSTWFNRLTYDAGLDESDRKTWVIHGPGSGSELRPYGLLGSVVVRYCEE